MHICMFNIFCHLTSLGDPRLELLLEETMSIIDKLSDLNVWKSFEEYKANSGHVSKSDLEDLSSFINNKEYLKVTDLISSNSPLPLPHIKRISKSSTDRKRIVFVYEREFKYVLKLLTYLIIRQYDSLFCPNLYSFRASRGVKHAIDFLTSRPEINQMYSYKVDVSDYFNSVNPELMIRILKDRIDDDGVIDFVSRLLLEPDVFDGDAIVPFRKGIIAGTPTAAFLANLYLADLDAYFYERGILYARYSDDIIVFAKTREQLDSYIKVIKEALANQGLGVNLSKEEISEPYGKWTFLGFSYCNGVIDVSPIAVHKLKRKIYRKSRALLRWKDAKNVDGVKAARALIKRFNTKLYDNPNDADITWSRWYFPSINTTDSLKEIDQYMVDTIRYMITGKRNKKRFDCRYEQIKALGYRSLVHEYYRIIDESKSQG